VPELPELEVVREVLTRRLGGRRIEAVTLAPKGAAVILRDLTGEGFVRLLTGSLLGEVHRRGKFLLFDFPRAPFTLAVNPKLSGRFQLCAPGAKKAGPVQATLHFTEPREDLRYVDSKQMGQLYLTRDTRRIPTFDEMGPDALDIDLQEFQRRLRSFRGEIKGILTRPTFVAGIGNAYADEILWQARLHPYRKRTALTADEIGALHQAMRQTLPDLDRAGPARDGRRRPPQAARFLRRPHARRAALPALRHPDFRDHRQPADHFLLPHLPAGRAGARGQVTLPGSVGPGGPGCV
jgi:formamidopyrimidine-DNA glycosylase